MFTRQPAFHLKPKYIVDRLAWVVFTTLTSRTGSTVYSMSERALKTVYVSTRRSSMKGRGARGEDPAVVQPKLTPQPMVMCGDGGRSTGANTHIKMFGRSAGTVRGGDAVRDYSHVVQTGGLQAWLLSPWWRRTFTVVVRLEVWACRCFGAFWTKLISLIRGVCQVCVSLTHTESVSRLTSTLIILLSSL